MTDVTNTEPEVAPVAEVAAENVAATEAPAEVVVETTDAVEVPSEAPVAEAEAPAEQV